MVRVVVLGATASGKSELALDVADRVSAGSREHGVEIINADASQLYRGMDIGTAKVPVCERRGYPHWQIDVLTVTDEASVAAYQKHARADAERIEARGATPIIVGGSGLYLRALTDNIRFPGTDPAIRQHFEERYQREGLSPLRAELARRDPTAEATITPGDARRVIRALEVITLTGQPFSATLPTYEDVAPTCHIGLRLDPDALWQRIRRRTDAMMRAGLIEEVRGLCDQGLREGSTAPAAIGYSQALAVIDGHLSPEQAAEEISLATRKLAAKQRKWFRRDPRIHWIDVPASAHGDVEAQAWEGVVQQALRVIHEAST